MHTELYTSWIRNVVSMTDGLWNKLYECKIYRNKYKNIPVHGFHMKCSNIAGACEYGNELLGSIKCREFLD